MPWARVGRGRREVGARRRTCARAAWGLGVGGRAVLIGGVRPKRVDKANGNERSRGRSLLHGQGMGKTQHHRNNIEQGLAVGGWRRSLGAVLNIKKRGGNGGC